jgi:AcrR family transcriptional regulator
MKHPAATPRTRAASTGRAGPRPRTTRPGSAARSERTRARLIEAGGQLFAELGLDGVTGQVICRRARVHTAAIVYHFGGVQGLYRAVLAEAQRRLVSNEEIAAAVGAQSDPKRQLEAFLSMIVQAVMSPASQSWAGRLFGREFITPSTVYGRAHDRALAARARLLKKIIGALLGCSPEDARVARACISTIAPCALLLLVDRAKLERLLPSLRVDAESSLELTRHLTDFAIAGLRAVAASKERT